MQRARPATAKYTLAAPEGPFARAAWAAPMAAARADDFSDSAAGRLALDLVGSGRAPATNKNYDSKVRFFLEFCGSREPPINVTALTIEDMIEYVAWQAQKGTVRMKRKEFQPYLSSINGFLGDLGLPRIAKNSMALNDAIKACAKRQKRAGPAPGRRIYMPARVMALVVDAAEACSGPSAYSTALEEAEELRPLLATVFSYQWFDRPHTAHSAHWEDWGVDLDGARAAISFFEREVKTNRDGGLSARAVTIAVRPGQNMQRRLGKLLLRFKQLKLRACPLLARDGQLFWALPCDAAPARWTSVVQNEWLQTSLVAVDERPPENFLWTAYSLRHGAASEAAAALMPRAALHHLGGWSPTSTVPQATYIDPTCPASAAGREFFGFLGFTR